MNATETSAIDGKTRLWFAFDEEIRRRGFHFGLGEIINYEIKNKELQLFCSSTPLYPAGTRGPVESPLLSSAADEVFMPGLRIWLVFM